MKTGNEKQALLEKSVAKEIYCKTGASGSIGGILFGAAGAATGYCFSVPTGVAAGSAIGCGIGFFVGAFAGFIGSGALHQHVSLDSTSSTQDTMTPPKAKTMQPN